MDNDVHRIVGVFRNGRIEIEGTVDWPDGATVVVSLDPNATKWNSDDRPRTPEEIEAGIKRMQELEPLSDDFAAILKANREWDRLCDLDCPRRSGIPHPPTNGLNGTHAPNPAPTKDTA